MQLSLSTAFVALAALVGTVAGETHAVHFVNSCGEGTPTLKAQDGTILSTGADYITNAPLVNAIAYLQITRSGRPVCGPAGENCTVIKTTLRNGRAGFASLTGVAVNSPYAFTNSAGFKYVNGCSGSSYCNSAQCAAQNNPVSCTVDDVDLSISFCAPP